METPVTAAEVQDAVATVESEMPGTAQGGRQVIALIKRMWTEILRRRSESANDSSVT